MTNSPTESLVARHEPGTLRVCPERDALCPHGIDCPYSIDYRCDMIGSRAELERRRARTALSNEASK